MGWHGIAGIGDARILDGVGEIDESERFRDAFMGDAHRLSPVFGRQRERGLQHIALGPAGISNVRASFLSGHVCFLYIACRRCAKLWKARRRIFSRSLSSSRGIPGTVTDPRHCVCQYERSVWYRETGWSARPWETGRGRTDHKRACGYFKVL